MFQRNGKKPSHFEMHFAGGVNTYFIASNMKGMIVGPETPGRDDHLTFGVYGDEITQVHRKTNGRETWRLTPEALQAEVDSFIANNTSEIEESLLEGSVYIISLDRLAVLFSAFLSLVSVVLSLVLRFVTSRKSFKTNNRVEYHVTLEPKRIRIIAEAAKRPAVILSPLLNRMIPILAPRLIRRLGRHVLISSKELKNLGDDAAFVISDNRIGIVWMGDNDRLRFLPLTAIVEAYQRVERNQPFGKLGEFSIPDIGALQLSAKSWISSASKKNI